MCKLTKHTSEKYRVVEKQQIMDEQKEEFRPIYFNTFTEEEFTEKENELKEELNAVIDKWANRGFSPIFELNERESGFMINWVEKVHFLNRNQRVLGIG